MPERSQRNSMEFQDPLIPNNAVNDGATNLGGNPSHDDGEISVISSQYRLSGNRINEYTLTTQPELGDENSFLVATKQHASTRPGAPIKLT